MLQNIHLMQAGDARAGLVFCMSAYFGMLVCGRVSKAWRMPLVKLRPSKRGGNLGALVDWVGIIGRF